ncbi:MAG: hypothetical protein R3C49_11530 [Planctomycetaceae bacterium]
MVVQNWLQVFRGTLALQLRGGVTKSRRSRRRRQLFSGHQVEAVEQRLLLSATTDEGTGTTDGSSMTDTSLSDPTASTGISDDELAAMYSSEDMSGSLYDFSDESYSELAYSTYSDTEMYFDSLAETPMGEDFSYYEDSYQTYETYADESLAETYDSYTDPMDGYSSDYDMYAEEGLSDTGSETSTGTEDGSAETSSSSYPEAAESDNTGESDPEASVSPDSDSTSMDDGTSGSSSDSSGSDLTDSSGSLLDDLMSGDSGSDSETDGDQSAEPPDPRFQFTAFQFPDELQFAPISLPGQDTSEDLMAVRPSGSDSYSTQATSASQLSGTAWSLTTGSADGDDDPASPMLRTSAGSVTDVTITTTDEQTWTSEDDWSVSQSVSRRFDRSEGFTAEGEDDEDFGRHGSETYTVTVINGTTTVRSYSISDTFTYSTGAIPGEADSDDPFAIPESWLTDASTSVNNTDENTTTSEDDPVPPSSTTAPASSDAAATPSGSPSAASSDDDGTGTYFVRSSSMDTTITDKRITLPDGTFATEHTVTVSWSASFSWRTGGSRTVTEADLPADAEPLPAGLTFTATSEFRAFASASIGTVFTATTVIPDGFSLSSLLGADVSASFGFATSAIAGGTMSSTLKADLDESSGSAADGTDVYEKLHIDDSSSSSGSTGFSFRIGLSTDDGESSGTGPDDTADADVPPDVIPSSGTPAPARPQPGAQSATQLLEDTSTGIQFTLGMSGSGNLSVNETAESKTRSTPFGGGTLSAESSSSETTTDSSDRHLTISFGTTENLVDIGSSGDYSTTISSQSTIIENVPYPGLTVNENTTISSYRNTSSSEYDTGLTLGGGLGFTLQNDSDFSVDVELISGHEWTRDADVGSYILKEIYVDYSSTDDPTPPEKIHRKTYTLVSGGTTTVHLEFEQAPASANLPNPYAQQSLSDILAEYLDRQTQLARLQTLLANTTDPDQQQYLQDQIDLQTSILTDLTTAATNAGATAAQLTQLNNQAATAAANNPIQLQQASGMTTWTPVLAAGSVFLLGVDLPDFMEGAWDDAAEVLAGGTAGATTGAVIGGGIGLTAAGVSAVPCAIAGGVVGFIGGAIGAWYNDPDDDEFNPGIAVGYGSLIGGASAYFVVGGFVAYLPAAAAGAAGPTAGQVAATWRYIAKLSQVLRGIGNMRR